MSQLSLAGRLQNVAKTDQVRIHIGFWMGQGITDPGLGREMDNPLWTFLFEQPKQGLAILKGKTGFAEPFPGLQSRQPGFLQADFVIVVDVIQPNHFIAPVQQRVSEVRSNESGGPGYQNFHIGVTVRLMDYSQKSLHQESHFPYHYDLLQPNNYFPVFL